MCPYAVSVTGTATTFDTAITAVIKLDKISQGSYPTKNDRSRLPQDYSISGLKGKLCNTYRYQSNIR